MTFGPKTIWVNPNNPAQQYWTCITGDPNIPAGYVLTNTTDGSAQIVDGVHDMDEQIYQAGVNSGGFPVYTGDPGQLAAQPNWPNGILGSAPGASTTH